MFKPMLAPNELIKFEEMKYPLFASMKLDGIRCIFKDGQMMSRTLKQIPNKQLQEKFEKLKELSKNNYILDGELYCHGRSFQEITRAVMTQDVNEMKTIKKRMKDLDMTEEEVTEYYTTLTSDIKFHCFDAIHREKYTMPFEDRKVLVNGINEEALIEKVEQITVVDFKGVVELFAEALENDYEGLILRSPDSPYKCGRGTLKEGYIYKGKPYQTFDAKIIDVLERTKVREGADKKINELGRSETSKKKDDRLPSGLASDFVVMYEDEEQKVSLSSMKHPQLKEVWDNRKDYIGQMVEYKGMLVGSKDKVRHPVFVRMREDKDETN